MTVSDKLRAIPPMLPALMRAEKVGKKAKCFDFSDEGEVLDKIDEEMREVRDAIEDGNAVGVEEEIGDLLLTVTSLCRKLKVDPEVALNRATDKFICRFACLEELVEKQGKKIDEMSVEQLNQIWDENKHKNQ